MILHGITLEEVDQAYQKVGLKELFVLPYYESDPIPPKTVLAGLITGSIETVEHFPNDKTAFLEHFMVLPEAKNRHAIKMQMPEEAARLLRARGIGRIVLCIDNDHPKFARLVQWAGWCHYEKYAEQYEKTWFVRNLNAQQEQHGKEQTEDAGPGCAAGPAAPAAPAR